MKVGAYPRVGRVVLISLCPEEVAHRRSRKVPKFLRLREALHLIVTEEVPLTIHGKPGIVLQEFRIKKAMIRKFPFTKEENRGRVGK